MLTKTMMTLKEHRAWMQKLKVGDKVCDCNFTHLKIKEIADEHMVWRPWLYRQVVFSDWMPTRLADGIDDVWDWVGRKLGIEVLTDRTLILEDGSQCSAHHCCDPVDHEWSHILKGTKEENEP